MRSRAALTVEGARLSCLAVSLMEQVVRSESTISIVTMSIEYISSSRQFCVAELIGGRRFEVDQTITVSGLRKVFISIPIQKCFLLQNKPLYGWGLIIIS